MEQFYFYQERFEKLLSVLNELRYTDCVPIENFLIAEKKPEGFENPEALPEGFSAFAPGQRWGGRDMHAWFRIEVLLPASYAGRSALLCFTTGREGQWDATNPQFFAYVNGEPVQGLDVNHRFLPLTGEARGGERFLVALEAYGGMQAGPCELNVLLCACDWQTECLYYNLRAPLETARLLPPDSGSQLKIYQAVETAVNMVDLRVPHSPEYQQSVQAANNYLENSFYKKSCENGREAVCCIGHTHIDVAWRWTLGQTREKTVRSFATALKLMEEYPEYRFMSSQPQLYAYFKKAQPALYEKLRARVSEGRWEPEGAMWLEADCNLASGESLVRQILYGKRFFRKEFGVDSRILWLPDVFGYSAALPQILKKSGVDYFMTSKISWNEYNKLPYDTFMWEGLDGTRILTQFITTQDLMSDTAVKRPNYTTYNGILNPAHLMGAWQRYQQKELGAKALMTYGYGDGGGGPTRDMLEMGRRMEKGIPGCPKLCRMSALEYFEDLEKTVKNNRKLPRWVGELYLEYHRGTYTSMARNKKYNRKSELLLQAVELFSQLSGGEYPAGDLQDCWETVLLNQFHDILPGSSIKEVYEESRRQYEQVLAKANGLLQNALSSLAGRLALAEERVVVFNPLGFSRTDLCELPGNAAQVLDEQGAPLPTQTAAGRTFFLARDIPSKGYRAFRCLPNSKKRPEEMPAGPVRKLENNFFLLCFNQSGEITELYDKRAGRQLLQKGERANVLQAFEDRPHRYDAWDINIYYQEKMWELSEASLELVADGEIFTCLKVVHPFLDSTVTQYICLYQEIPRIDFKTTIDWKQSHILLKAAFPVDIHSSRATYDIQFGNVERPTHWNTSWDWARFEVCAHQWADLSEDGYGAALLNDCKYGHDIRDGVMRLTLLKSATEPNPDADREIHEFTYSLYPHLGGWREGEVPAMAGRLNSPLYALREPAHSGSLPLSASFASLDAPGVMLESCKRAEEGSDTILRLVEIYNRRTRVTLHLKDEIESACECDLMENPCGELHFEHRTVMLDLLPYEIKSVRIRFSGME